MLILAALARLFVIAYLPGASTRGRLWGERHVPALDPWVEAQALAAQGRYTEAAHALYSALLARVAARTSLRLDPSKTAGDYARDLRTAGPAAWGPFRDFARSYEVVVYGLGTCDRARFETLAALAGRLDPELARAAA